MKVALLFSGQPRFITNPFTFASHKREILDKYETDVFAHIWFDQNQKEFEFSSFSEFMDTCPVNPDSINIFSQLYNPKILQIEKPRKFSFSPEAKQLLEPIMQPLLLSDRNSNNSIFEVISDTITCVVKVPCVKDDKFLV